MFPTISRPGIALAFILLAGLTLRLGWIAYADFTPTLSDDAGRYDLLGRSLAAGGGFVNPNGNATMFWPPGYPFTLAALYAVVPAAHEVTAALLLNVVAGLATVGLVYLLALHIVKPAAVAQWPAVAAAGAFALLPSAVFFTSVTLTETWFTFLLMSALYLVVAAQQRRSGPLLVAAGLVLGCAALVRGPALLVPVALVPFWLAASDGSESGRSVFFRTAAVTALAVGIVVPWTIRNFVQSDALVALSSNAGVDFYIGHSDGATGRGRIVNELVFRYPELPPAEAEARVSRDGFREGLEFAVRNPIRELELSVRKVWFLYNGDHEALAWTDAHGEQPFMAERTRNALAVLSSGYYFVLMVAATFGIFAWFRARGWRSNATGVLLVSVIVYWTLVHVAFFGDQRFHAPILPIMCVWVAFFVHAHATKVTQDNAPEP